MVLSREMEGILKELLAGPKSHSKPQRFVRQRSPIEIPWGRLCILVAILMFVGVLCWAGLEAVSAAAGIADRVHQELLLSGK